MQGDEALEVIGEVRAMFGQALRKGIPGQVVGMAQVVAAGKLRKHATIVHEAAH